MYIFVTVCFLNIFFIPTVWRTVHVRNLLILNDIFVPYKTWLLFLITIINFYDIWLEYVWGSNNFRGYFKMVCFETCVTSAWISITIKIAIKVDKVQLTIPKFRCFKQSKTSTYSFFTWILSLYQCKVYFDIHRINKDLRLCLHYTRFLRKPRRKAYIPWMGLKIIAAFSMFPLLHRITCLYFYQNIKTPCIRSNYHL